jgi:hypothetical protein
MGIVSYAVGIENAEAYEKYPDPSPRYPVGKRVYVDVVGREKGGTVHAVRVCQVTEEPRYWVKFDERTEMSEIPEKLIMTDG